MTTKTFDVREINERGFGILDEALKEGPVHITKGTEPAYVLLSEADFARLAPDGEDDRTEGETFEESMKKSLEDIASGRVRAFSTANEVMEAIRSYPEE